MSNDLIEPTVPVSDLDFEDPDLPTASFSPMATVQGIWPGDEPSPVE